MLYNGFWTIIKVIFILLLIRFMAGNDFFEGVRTVFVDKGDTPKWTHQDPL